MGLGASAKVTLAGGVVKPLGMVRVPSLGATLGHDDQARSAPLPEQPRFKNWNEDTPWSEMDIFDLRTSLELGHSVATVADFLMRREDELRRKAIELGLLSPDQNGGADAS